ncbi:hypothetical protein GCM10010967_05040 [Dyadobacter beijingensis]|uniref:Restriction endonuclease type IV Mrr domain-containing protein n=1 Tax=Dyadobacter beijingensis TaxID=365489 RepID=A0ABQ2HEN8_9BACT|nr:restriction endonuclease [Dyadobacter beijingensis]GGM76407.1 hypothetical protein GCM10010967_05040 [Dyadobacter beijingensis]
MKTFFEHIIDWKEFEKFVAEIYQDSENFAVEHNVIEIGKSGTKRQIDVRVTQKSKLHTLKILIECKKWRKRVDRQVVDVLSASIEDLNGDKGVIFTTVGYEAGAVQYARSKNIDIFLIRDLLDEEWGKTGRQVHFYLHFLNCNFSSINFRNSRYTSCTNRPPASTPKFEVAFGTTTEAPTSLILYNELGEIGPNLVDIFLSFRKILLENLSLSIDKSYFSQDNQEKRFENTVTFDFTHYPFNRLKHENGYILFDEISLKNLQSISQRKIEYDKADAWDFAIVVENFITNQKNFISKSIKQSKLNLSDPISPPIDVDNDRLLVNGSIMTIILAPLCEIPVDSTIQVEQVRDIKFRLR